METVFEKAKKLANKLADERNRQNYDPSCMNLALFADDDPNKPQFPPKEPEPVPGVEAVAPDFTLNQRPTVRNVNPIYPEAKEEELPPPLPETPPIVRENSLNGYVKPVFHSKFSGPWLRKSKSQDSNTQPASLPTQLPQQTINPVTPKEVYPGETCYYVLITHTSTYPAPGSQVLMRSCDHEYVWTNEQSEEEKPNHKVCTHCGRKTGYTQTEIE